MEPSTLILMMSNLRLFSLILSILIRLRLCMKSPLKKVVMNNDARILFSSDFVFLCTTFFNLMLVTALLDILLMGLFCIFVSKMEELYAYTNQLRIQHRTLRSIINDEYEQNQIILMNQFQSSEARAKQLNDVCEHLVLTNYRLLEENSQLESEVGTKTKQVDAAETNAIIVKKQYIELLLDYDRLLEENKNLKNQLDWEIVASAYRE